MSTLQSPRGPMQTGHHFFVRSYLKGIIHVFISICFIAFITIVTYPPVNAARYLPALGRGKIHFPLSALKVTAPFSRVISGAHPGLPNSVLLLLVPADFLGQGEEALPQQGIRKEAALELRKEHY